jgi:IS30 family transposase
MGSGGAGRDRICLARPRHAHDPVARHQRGVNENISGLVRQCFPKRSDFSKITDKQINKVVERLNQRLRKTLGYNTPHEVFFKLPLVALAS